MRESVQKKYQRAEKQKRTHHKRIILYTFLLSAAVFLGVWLTLTSRAMDRQVSTLHQDSESHIAEIKAHALEQRDARARITATENESVKKLVYARMSAGDLTPPTLKDMQCNYLRTHDDPTRPDAMINKANCIKPLRFEPTLTSVEGMLIATSAVDDYKKLLSAVRAAGYDLTVTSSYRSYADQGATYIYWETTEGRAEADRHSAYAGYSEHQTGYAVDFMTDGCGLDCFGRTDVYDWLVKHAHEYGFIERYPKGMENTTGYAYEPWHWRYIGVKEAKLYHSTKANSLEDFWGIS
ncbi:MAG TPA: M15 family metallopeptidase [Patescibacteria group bacterium]|jgi:D-alanyl-D-alanine carboxypeptidase|nr:M15 family metallopeptidase [Patescibacteria group bacterium]